MVEADYTLHADADGDELFETDEALIDGVRDSDGITYSRGLDGIRRLDEARAGDFGAYLDNRAGTYNPGAAGEIQRGVSLKLRAAYGGTTRDLCHVDVSRVKHWPALTKKAVELRGRGKLARFARRPVSTTLYQNITTGEAIGYVLDALDYAKNAQPYITSLTPAGQWGLGGAAGTDTDLSGNGNDATVTYAAGQRGAAALDDGGDGATTFEEGTLNRITNPAFGVDLTGVGASGPPPVSFTRVASGAEWACEVVTDASAGGQGIYQAVDGGAGGTTYAVSAELSGSGTVRLAMFDTVGGFQEGASIALSATLTRHSAVFTTGVAGGVVRFYIVTPTASAQAITFQIKKMQAEAKAYATSYCDGSLGTGYSWSGTAHASTSTRVSTYASIPDAAPLQNLFDGGGGLGLLFNAAVQTANRQLVRKGNVAGTTGWGIRLLDVSGSTCKIRFDYRFTNDAEWTTTDRVVTFGVNYALVEGFNADSTANNPTFYLIDLDTGTCLTLTVGSGITEDTSPTGTRTSDVGDLMAVGVYEPTTIVRQFNGVIDEPAVFSTLPTAAQAKAWAARCMNAPRHLDAGQTTLPFYHANATDALQELMRIVRSEGPGAYLYEDASGAITFLDRHATITQARSTSAQGTLRGTGTAPLYSDYDYEDGLDDVINLVKVSAVRRALSAAGYLWQSQLPYASLAPGETKKVTAKLDDPGTGFVTGLLTTNPTYASTLAAAIGDTTTLTFTLPTGEATMITTNAIIDIEGEYMLVASRATGSPNDTVTVVSRGAYGTTAATHLISTAVRTRAFIASAESTFGNATNLTDSITVTISRTGGISTEFSFTNNAAVTAYLFARLYGQEAAIQERYELKNTVDASASIAAHGERSYDLDVIPEVDVDVLQDWCNAVVGWYQDGRPTVTVEVIGNLGADEMAQALDREIADRVRVIHAGTGVDLQALVHRIETTVELGGALHRARLLCESADTASYLKFGTSTFGGADLFAW